jgi:hypothetical protein
MADNQAASHAMLTDVTTTAAGEVYELGSDNKTFHVVGSTTSGAGAATVVVEVSNNTSWPWLTLATFSLTLDTVAVADGAVMQAGWKYVRARVSAISGTGATISAAIGV